MVKFCETEPVSFLDEVAADVTTMRLAEMVASEVHILYSYCFSEDLYVIEPSFKTEYSFPG